MSTRRSSRRRVATKRPLDEDNDAECETWVENTSRVANAERFVLFDVAKGQTLKGAARSARVLREGRPLFYRVAKKEKINPKKRLIVFESLKKLSTVPHELRAALKARKCFVDADARKMLNLSLTRDDTVSPVKGYDIYVQSTSNRSMPEGKLLGAIEESYVSLYQLNGESELKAPVQPGPPTKKARRARNWGSPLFECQGSELEDNMGPFPVEVWHLIYLRLDVLSAARLAGTSRAMRETSMSPSVDALWRGAYIARWLPDDEEPAPVDGIDTSFVAPCFLAPGSMWRCRYLYRIMCAAQVASSPSCDSEGLITCYPFLAPSGARDTGFVFFGPAGLPIRISHQEQDGHFGESTWFLRLRLFSFKTSSWRPLMEIWSNYNCDEDEALIFPLHTVTLTRLILGRNPHWLRECIDPFLEDLLCFIPDDGKHFNTSRAAFEVDEEFEYLRELDVLNSDA